MPVSAIPTYKPTSNQDLLNALRAGLSDQYQARIPAVTKASIQDAIQTLMEVPVLKNEFVDALVNRIGLVIFRSKIWRNPLASFKIDPIQWGAVIEEVQVGLLEAKVYDPDRDYMEKELFGRELPPVETAYHKINRQNYYKVTINDKMLQRAFLNDFGLSQMVTNLMNSLYNSDNNDEFLLTCSLFAEYARNGGFFKVHTQDVASDESGEAQAKALLRQVRAMAGNLEFFSPHYNAAGLPTYAAQEDLVLFVSPEVKAAMDVEAFAAAFNIPYTDVPGRVITIPKGNFGINGVQAILTTKDFFVLADTLMENRNIQNPANLHINYFFHHHQILSLSLFVPAILFWTGQGDVITSLDTPVTGISAITATYSQDGTAVTDPAPLTRGELYIMDASATTTPADGFNNGVRWSIAGNASNGTFISQTGNLIISGLETATSIDVTATTSWIDPAGVERDGDTVTRTFLITGALLPLWPRKDIPTDIKVEGTSVVPPFAIGTFAYTAITPTGTVNTVDDVVMTGVAAGGYEVTLNTAKDVATVTLTSGTDAVYTVTVNPPA
jgi:hypothetical protein